MIVEESDLYAMCEIDKVSWIKQLRYSISCMRKWSSEQRYDARVLQCKTDNQIRGVIITQRINSESQVGATPWKESMHEDQNANPNGKIKEIIRLSTDKTDVNTDKALRNFELLVAATEEIVVVCGILHTKNLDHSINKNKMVWNKKENIHKDYGATIKREVILKWDYADKIDCGRGIIYQYKLNKDTGTVMPQEEKQENKVTPS